MKNYSCRICGKSLSESETYEYRGVYSCAEHLDEVSSNRDRQREEVIRQESAKTEPLRGLDLGDSAVGKANRQMLKSRIEAASTPGKALLDYESGAQQPTEKRFVLRADNDGHWFCIPESEAKRFDLLLNAAHESEEYEEFNEAFDDMMINGPFSLSFTNPRSGSK